MIKSLFTRREELIFSKGDYNLFNATAMQHIVKALSLLFLRYGNFVEARTKIEQEYAGKLR